MFPTKVKKEPIFTVYDVNIFLSISSKSTTVKLLWTQDSYLINLQKQRNTPYLSCTEAQPIAISLLPLLWSAFLVALKI